MNQRLIRLKPAELPVNMDELEIRPSSLERLRELYAGWGFKTMLAQLGGAPLTQGALL